MELEVVRGGASKVHIRSVPSGTLLRAVIRDIGEAAEGSAVLLDGVSIPLDTPLDRSVRLLLLPTFSGG